VRLLVALINPPTGEECAAHGLTAGSATGKAAAARVTKRPASNKGFTMKLLGTKHSAFGRLATASGGGR
jgi:hypothetical protein